MLKEDVVGMLLVKLLDFRDNDGFEGEDGSSADKEEEYRETETYSFNTFLTEKCNELLEWLLKNISNYVHKLPMLVKKLLGSFKY